MLLVWPEEEKTQRKGAESQGRKAITASPVSAPRLCALAPLRLFLLLVADFEDRFYLYRDAAR